ncbi:MAG: hypothetical protein ACRC10_06630 [Thermoguttaceae bacterium]
MDPKFLNTRCYRFAFIGSTSSGKTCMLAELAVNHDSSDRFTTIVKPLDFQPLSDDELKTVSTDKMLRLKWNFQTGAERLKAAQEHLSKGQRPEPTTRSDARPMLEFAFGDTEGRGDFGVWTEDYPGEFLAVEQFRDPTSDASQLRDRLLQYDGLMIVVDTVANESQISEVRQQIENLCQFFASLSEQIKSGAALLDQIPVAILLSKWDRFSNPIQFNSIEAERQKLEEYLQKYPFYKALIKMIHSNAQEQEAEPTGDLLAGLAYGNTAVFPVSAFGRSIQDGLGNEGPDPGSLSESFGLVAPFYWLACRCDDIHIDKMEKQYKAMRFVWPRGLFKLRQQANLCYRRISGRTPTKERFHALLWKSLLTLILCVAFWVFVLGAVVDGVYEGVNSYQVRTWENTMIAPDSSAEDLQKARDRLESYRKRPYKGLVAPGGQRIDENIAQIDSRITELYWKPVEAATEPSLKSEAAREYLEKYPNGSNAQEAHAIIQKYREGMEQQSWKGVTEANDVADKAKRAEQYLEEYDKKGTAIYRAEAYKIRDDYRISTEQKMWDNVLTAEEESVDQKNRAETYLARYNEKGDAKFQNEANQIIQNVNNGIGWDKARNAYQRECDGDNIINIIGALKNLIVSHGVSQEHCQPLIEQLPELIANKLSVKARNTNARSMIDECENVARSTREMEALLRTKKADTLADSLLQSARSTEESRKNHIDAYDSSLYQEVQNAKNEDSCKCYLTNMGSMGNGAMSEQVTEYKKYLEAKKSRQEIVYLNIKLYWGPKTDYYRVRGIIKFDEREIYNDRRKTWKHDEKNLAENIELRDIDPGRQYKIEARFASEGNSWGNDCTFGEGQDNYYLSELIQGKTLKLDGQYGYDGRLIIKAVAPSIPAEPELPTWTKK